MDGETRFEIGSITKVLTHLLLAESIGQGKVKDDTTIADLLGSDFAFAQPEVGKITLRELATHSSGCPDYRGIWCRWMPSIPTRVLVTLL